MDGPEFDPSAPPRLPVEGQATYAGQAGGLYSYELGSDWGEDEGAFVIDEYEGVITLTADFADATLSGCIGCAGDLVTRRAHFGIFLGDEVRDVQSVAADYELHFGVTPFDPGRHLRAYGRGGQAPRSHGYAFGRGLGRHAFQRSRPGRQPPPGRGVQRCRPSRKRDGSIGEFFGTFVALSETFRAGRVRRASCRPRPLPPSRAAGEGAIVERRRCPTMTNGTIMRLAALAGAMLLAGCLGGGGGGTLSPEDVEKVRSDDRVVRAKGIYERADTLLIPSLYLKTRSSVLGTSRSQDFALRGQCSGTNCTVSDDRVRFPVPLEDLMISDLIVPVDVDLNKAELGERDGFDTLIAEGGSRTSTKISDDEIATSAGSATSYGLWGKYGYAAVELAVGSLQEGSISARISGALAYAFGNRNPTNPEGTGSATWEGVAEVASTRTFTRSQGKATLTIPDLARPRIGAAIELAGSDISKPSWKDMPLSQGGFTAGTVNGEDYIEGNFHGPKHGEAYGVFDTGAYVGAFGAMRK